MDSSLQRQSCLLFTACFPGVTLQPKLHDPISAGYLNVRHAFDDEPWAKIV